jgi:hypothetical protein
MISRLLEEINESIFGCATVVGAPKLEKLLKIYSQHKKTAEFYILKKSTGLDKIETLIIFNIVVHSSEAGTTLGRVLAKTKKESGFKDSKISHTLMLSEYNKTWTVCGVKSLRSGKWLVKPILNFDNLL